MKVVGKRVWGLGAVLGVFEGSMGENRDTTCGNTFQVKRKRMITHYICYSICTFSLDYFHL